MSMAEEYENNPSTLVTVSIHHYETLKKRLRKYEEKLGLLEGQVFDANEVIRTLYRWHKNKQDGNEDICHHYLSTWRVK